MKKVGHSDTIGHYIINLAKALKSFVLNISVLCVGGPVSSQVCTHKEFSIIQIIHHENIKQANS